MATEMASGTIELEARGLSVSFPTDGRPLEVLRGIDLAVARGAFLAVLGPSGAGKTTLLNAFAGFVPPTAGAVLHRGRPIAGPSAERAVVFQRHALMPWLDVADNVAFPLRLKGVGKSRSRLLVRPLLDRVGLGDFHDRSVWTLSGGMQQRVGFARALAAEPEVLLLDEPLGALDLPTREGLQELLVSLWGGSRTTALLITHDIEEAVFLATDLVVLSPRPGRILARRALPFSRSVAAGEDPVAVRSDPDFLAVKAELRALIDPRPPARLRAAG